MTQKGKTTRDFSSSSILDCSKSGLERQAVRSHLGFFQLTPREYEGSEGSRPRLFVSRRDARWSIEVGPCTRARPLCNDDGIDRIFSAFAYDQRTLDDSIATITSGAEGFVC
jgi:hypothetical protein